MWFIVASQSYQHRISTPSTVSVSPREHPTWQKPRPPWPGSTIAHVFVADPLALTVDAPMGVEMPEGFAGLILDESVIWGASDSVQIHSLIITEFSLDCLETGLRMNQASKTGRVSRSHRIHGAARKMVLHGSHQYTPVMLAL